MPDIVTLPDSRSARLVKTSTFARELVGRSAAIARVHELVRRAALAGGGVLLVADRGVDVESVARELHERTRRPAGPFERVECGAAESGRLDRLLFGAPPAVVPSDLESAASDSRIAAACGGTLFLKDITEMPASVQARIARVARDGEVRIDGEPTATNLRWAGSAAPGIEADVHANRFSRRSVPPAVRVADRPPVASRSCGRCAYRRLPRGCSRTGAPRRRARRAASTQAALALLSALTWPGNVAELHVVIERAATNSPHDVISNRGRAAGAQPRPDRQGAHARGARETGNLRDARLRFERDYISSVLQHHGWRMAGGRPRSRDPAPEPVVGKRASWGFR